MYASPCVRNQSDRHCGQHADSIFDLLLSACHRGRALGGGHRVPEERAAQVHCRAVSRQDAGGIPLLYCRMSLAGFPRRAMVAIAPTVLCAVTFLMHCSSSAACCLKCWQMLQQLCAVLMHWSCLRPASWLHEPGCTTKVCKSTLGLRCCWQRMRCCTTCQTSLTEVF